MEPGVVFSPLEGPKGGLTPPDAEPSLGELRPVDVPDIDWVVGM